ncbi:transglutaminase-like domain-containing protein [Oscillospiraceae bacterium WX1]
MAIFQGSFISFLLGAAFFVPLLVGLFRPLTAERIYYSLNVTLSAVIFLVSAWLAVLLSGLLLSGVDLPRFLADIPFLGQTLSGGDVLAAIVLAILLLVGLNGALQLLASPFVTRLLRPLSNKLGRVAASGSALFRRLAGSLWQLPKAVWLLLLVTLLCNFYTGISGNATLGSAISGSAVYRLVDDFAVQPILTSDIVRRFPASLDETVDKAVDCLSPEGRRLFVRVYINGVLVDDAVTSDPDIDNMAISLVGAAGSAYKKGEILYEWVSDNIAYDNDKAASIMTNDCTAPSGAVAAFHTRRGICFDKACLYVAMCRAVGIKVRLVTGKGYNGSVWLEHSWNQIYDDKNDRWVNADTTFGGKGIRYFDSAAFFVDHDAGEIQGIW